MSTANPHSEFTAFFLVIAQVLAAFVPHTGQAETPTFNSVAKFYRGTELGSLGVEINPRTIAKAESGSTFKVGPREELEFVVNNRSLTPNTSLTANGEAYLAVEVLRIFDSGIPIPRAISLFRNDNWTRPRVNDGPVNPPDLKRFVSLHNLENSSQPHDAESVNKALGWEWHAETSARGGYASIRDAWFWTQPYGVSDLGHLLADIPEPIRSDEDHIQMHAYLIRFSEGLPTATEQIKDLRFVAKAHHCKALYVQTYSPLSDEYRNFVLIDFTK